MSIDPGLLERARAAGDRLAEAERQAFLARADYHTAIRRMHLAGGSLREVAQALSLSHQRVQQIVRAAGGSWWMVWKSRRAARDPVCTWCGRPPAEVSKLIAGPKVFICDACVEAAERGMSGADGATGGSRRPATAGTRPRCAFCRKRANETRRIVTGAASVCSECLAVCREILDHGAG
jgi:hypothetical protein